MSRYRHFKRASKSIQRKRPAANKAMERDQKHFDKLDEVEKMAEERARNISRIPNNEINTDRVNKIRDELNKLYGKRWERSIHRMRTSENKAWDLDKELKRVVARKDKAIERGSERTSKKVDLESLDELMEFNWTNMSKDAIRKAWNKGRLLAHKRSKDVAVKRGKVLITVPRDFKRIKALLDGDLPAGVPKRLPPRRPSTIKDITNPTPPRQGGNRKPTIMQSLDELMEFGVGRERLKAIAETIKRRGHKKQPHETKKHITHEQAWTKGERGGAHTPIRPTQTPRYRYKMKSQQRRRLKRAKKGNDERDWDSAAKLSNTKNNPYGMGLGGSKSVDTRFLSKSQRESLKNQGGYPRG